MAKGYWLTGRDRDDLREILRAYRSGAFAQPAKNKSHREFAAIQEIAIGITYEAIAAGGSGLVDRWTVTNDAFAETSPLDQVTAYDWFGSGIPIDTKVVLVRLAHKSGTRWVAVREGGGGSLVFIDFELNEALSTADETAEATVLRFWGGEDPGDPVTVRNFESSAAGVYVFSGLTGATGKAVENPDTGQFEILNMMCG